MPKYRVELQVIVTATHTASTWAFGDVGQVE